MKLALAIFGLLNLTLGAAAQSAGDGERTFRNAVEGKQLYLRGFSADAQTRWRWDAGKLIEQPPLLHSIGVFKVKSVNFKGDRVELIAERQTLMRSSQTELALAPDKEQANLTVDLTGADRGAVLSTLAEMLFYPNRSAALADLPAEFRDHLPAPINKDCCGNPANEPPSKCDCADTTGSCSTAIQQPGRPGLKHPSVLYSVEPEFSEEARKKKLSTTIQVGLEVNLQGRPSNLWIVRPGPFGLSEKAGAAVAQYKFRPATCHGQPLNTSLYIEINFQIF